MPFYPLTIDKLFLVKKVTLHPFIFPSSGLLAWWIKLRYSQRFLEVSTLNLPQQLPLQRLWHFNHGQTHPSALQSPKSPAPWSDRLSSCECCFFIGVINEGSLLSWLLLLIPDACSHNRIFYKFPKRQKIIKKTKSWQEQ